MKILKKLLQTIWSFLLHIFYWVLHIYSFRITDVNIPTFCLVDDKTQFIAKIQNTGWKIVSVYLRVIVSSPYDATVAFDSDKDLLFHVKNTLLRHKDIKPGEIGEIVVEWKVPKIIKTGVYYTSFELWSPSRITAPNSLLYPPVRFIKTRKKYGNPEISDPINKRVFISYARDNAEHCEWVKLFAEYLRRFGIQVVMDLNPDFLTPGDQLKQIILKERNSFDYILIICSKWYTQKADSPKLVHGSKTGVRIETEAFSEPSFLLQNIDRFIPIVRDNKELKRTDKLPSYLKKLNIIYEDMDCEDWKGRAFTNLINKVRG